MGQYEHNVGNSHSNTTIMATVLKIDFLFVSRNTQFRLEVCVEQQVNGCHVRI